jgi:hypothetical protein
MERMCKATRADGRPCQGAPLASGFCFAHDPQLKEQRQAGNEQGGRHKARTARLQRLVPQGIRPVLDRLVTALEETNEGRLDPRTASAMAALAGSIVKVYELVELDQRLERLEQRHGRPG